MRNNFTNPKKHFIEIPGIDSSFPFAASLIATETTLSVFIINGRLITGMLSFPPIVSKNGVSTGPGHTIVTVVPVFFNSLRSALEKLAHKTSTPHKQQSRLWQKSRSRS